MFGWLKKAPLSSITILLTVGIGVITNLVTNEFSWPMVLILLGLILLALWIDFSQQNKTPDTTQLDKKNREILLRKIAYRSTAALPKADELIDLAFAAAEQFLQPAIVEFRENRVERDLPEQPISRIFEENGQKLLVLGEPGSGKTTLLYRLAFELTDAAQQDAEKPIPLIINLSSWPKRPTGASLEDWLLSEMQLGYDIPKQYGQKLLADRQVTFLLDGLDEVAEAAREACLDAIDSYFKNLTPVAVCCRTKEYELLRRKLHFEFAVRIKPLSPEQVAASLDALKLNRLTEAWQRHEALREVLNTPLMVRVAATALADEALPEAELTDAASASKALWRAYARHALHAKKKMEENRHPAKYSEADTWRWLQWLARTLDKRDLTNFYVERMQPDMLPENKMLFFRALNSFTFSLTLGLAFGLAFGLAGDLAYGLTVVLIVGLGYSLVVVLIGSLTRYFSRFLKKFDDWLIDDFRRNFFENEITPFEDTEFIWHPMKFLKNTAFGLGVGLVAGLMLGLVAGLMLGLATGLMVGLAIGSVVGLALGLALGLATQFVPYWIKEEFRTRPNEGIYKSGRFALKFSLIGLTFMLLGFVFQDIYFMQYSFGNTYSVYHLFYLLGAMIMGLLPYENGGAAYYRHYILRFLLYRAGCIPYRYVHFLEFACRLGFLRRVGGGYTFYHRELRDFIVQEEEMP